MKILLIIVGVIIAYRFLGVFIKKAFGNARKLFIIFLISGLIWIPATFSFIVKHPIKSVVYGFKISKGVGNMKKDFKKHTPTDRYSLGALRRLPKDILSAL